MVNENKNIYVNGKSKHRRLLQKRASPFPDELTHFTSPVIL